MGGKQEVVCTIHFGLYNIRNGRNMGIESSLCGMSQVNIYVGIF